MKNKEYSLPKYDQLMVDVLNKITCEMANNPKHWVFELEGHEDEDTIVYTTFSNRVRYLQRVILPKTITKTLLYKKVYGKGDYKIYCPHCFHLISKEETKYSHCPYCGGEIQTKETEETYKKINAFFKKKIKMTKKEILLMEKELEKAKIKESV